LFSAGDKEYPPSTVLGIGKGVSSGVFGVTSGLALMIGLYCVAQSNLLNILSGSTVNGWYVAGSLLVPYCASARSSKARNPLLPLGAAVTPL